MRIQSQKPIRGFSLVELLLTLVLILCLAAASVFCYTAIHKQANLDEGVDRLASILRFARAEAATTGRKVRVQFVTPAVVEGEKSELKAIKVEWEPDYLKAPGVFQTYTNKAWSEEVVNELVAVEKVEPLKTEEPKAAPMPALESATNVVTQDLADAELDLLAGFEVQEMPAITFYPDGSCDSAQIIVASRNEEDTRRAEVTISGILGDVSTRMLGSAEENGLENKASEMSQEEYEALWDSSSPSSVSSESSFSRTSGEFSAN